MAQASNVFVQVMDAQVVSTDDGATYHVAASFQAVAVDADGHVVPFASDEDGMPLAFWYGGDVRLDATETGRQLQEKITVDVRDAFGDEALTVSFPFDRRGSA